MASTQTTARLAEIPLPDFGMPDTEPLLPTTIFAERLARLRVGDGRTADTPTSSSGPTASTAPTSPTSAVSTRASRRRC